MITANIKAIVFDAEGVVVDTETLWDKSQEILMARRDLKYDRSLLKPLMAGRSIHEGIGIMKQYFQFKESDDILAEERKQLISNLFETEVEYIPGFNEFFNEVRQKRLNYCIATSMDPSLMNKVDRKLAIRALFDGHVYHVTDAGNRSKPDPAVFLLAADRLDIDPAQCLVIEDSPHGITAAKKAGMQCWALTTTFEAALLEHADRICENYRQVGSWFFEGE